MPEFLKKDEKINPTSKTELHANQKWQHDSFIPPPIYQLLFHTKQHFQKWKEALNFLRMPADPVKLDSNSSNRHKKQISEMVELLVDGVLSALPRLTSAGIWLHIWPWLIYCNCQKQKWKHTEMQQWAQEFELLKIRCQGWP